MAFDGRILRLEKEASVQFDGVYARDDGQSFAFEPVHDDAYVMVFNSSGQKLFVFYGGGWWERQEPYATGSGKAIQILPKRAINNIPKSNHELAAKALAYNLSQESKVQRRTEIERQEEPGPQSPRGTTKGLRAMLQAAWSVPLLFLGGVWSVLLLMLVLSILWVLGSYLVDRWNDQITEFPAFCWDPNCIKVSALPRVTFTIDKQRGEVAFRFNGEWFASPKDKSQYKLTNCSIVSRTTWTCAWSGTSDEISFFDGNISKIDRFPIQSNSVSLQELRKYKKQRITFVNRFYWHLESFRNGILE